MTFRDGVYSRTLGLSVKQYLTLGVSKRVESVYGVAFIRSLILQCKELALADQ